MQLSGKLSTLPQLARHFLAAFLLSLTFGYGTGFYFLQHMSGLSPDGVETQYLGNEEDENAEELIFKKSEQAIVTTIHNHSLSLSVIFLLVGALVLLTNLPSGLKKFLIIEPFFSIITTFGGIWLLWKGWLWMKWIIMISGTMMHLVFLTSVVLLFHQLYFVKGTRS